jgi:hypothetical protein
LAKLTKRREKTQINKIRVEKVDITTDISENQKIIREYFVKLYSNPLGNLVEIDKFLYNLSKLSQKDTNNLNRSITSNEIKAVKSLPTKKSSRPDGFTAEFYQTFKEELTPKLLKLFRKIEREGMLPNLL